MSILPSILTLFHLFLSFSQTRIKNSDQNRKQHTIDLPSFSKIASSSLHHHLHHHTPPPPPIYHICPLLKRRSDLDRQLTSLLCSSPHLLDLAISEASNLLTSAESSASLASSLSSHVRHLNLAQSRVDSTLSMALASLRRIEPQMAAVRIPPRLCITSILLQSASKSTIDFYLSYTPSPSGGAVARSMSSSSSNASSPAPYTTLSKRATYERISTPPSSSPNPPSWSIYSPLRLGCSHTRPACCLSSVIRPAWHLSSFIRPAWHLSSLIQPDCSHNRPV